jgi:hypothetical protein
LADSAKIDCSNFGVANVSTAGPATVDCPGQIDAVQSRQVSAGTMTFYNRNPNGFYCTMMGLNDAGIVVWSTTTGTSVVASYPQAASFFTHPSDYVYQVVLECPIPAVYNGSYSFLSSYTVTTL